MEASSLEGFKQCLDSITLCSAQNWKTLMFPSNLRILWHANKKHLFSISMEWNSCGRLMMLLFPLPASPFPVIQIIAPSSHHPTCLVAIAGLTHHLIIPTIKIGPTVFTVRSTRIVPAVHAMTTMPSAPVQFPVIIAFLWSTATVACWIKTGEKHHG